MLTLILSNLITIENYQKIIAIISLCIDVIASLVLIVRVLKTKNLDAKTLKNLIDSTNKNKQTILKSITEIIERFESEEKEHLNGSTVTNRTAYAPTEAGSSGQYLQSCGSGAPTWTSLTSLKNPKALTLIVNGTRISYDGSTIESRSWYAPTTVGTSGYYLVSRGFGAPIWSEDIDDGDID